MQTLHVRRIFDEAHKTLLYIAYSTGLANDTVWADFHHLLPPIDGPVTVLGTAVEHSITMLAKELA